MPSGLEFTINIADVLVTIVLGLLGIMFRIGIKGRDDLTMGVKDIKVVQQETNIHLVTLNGRMGHLERNFSDHCQDDKDTAQALWAKIEKVG